MKMKTVAERIAECGNPSVARKIVEDADLDDLHQALGLLRLRRQERGPLYQMVKGAVQAAATEKLLESLPAGIGTGRM